MPRATRKLPPPPPRKRRGRPALAPDARASVLIGFRVKPADRARYDAAAEAAGLTLTDWIVALIDRAAPPR